MKTIEFKKISKELIEEGISIELLHKVQQSGKLSPAMFQKGDDPVNLVRCNDDFYWVLLDDGKYLKDEKNQLIKFSLKTCIIARARYWLLFSDKEIEMDNKRKEEAKEKEIAKEIEKIKIELKEKVKDLNQRYDKLCRYAERKEQTGIASILNYMERDNDLENFELRKKSAIEFFNNNPTIDDFICKLNSDLQTENFDSLYVSLETKGLPLLLSVNHNTDSGIELLKRFFHKDKIEGTIEMIKDKSHIECVAIFNVNKRYV